IDMANIQIIKNSPSIAVEFLEVLSQMPAQLPTLGVALFFILMFKLMSSSKANKLLVNAIRNKGIIIHNIHLGTVCPFACLATITNTMNSKDVKIRSTSIDTGNKSLTYGLNILIADTAIIESCVNSIYMLNVYSGDFLLLIRLKAKMTVNTFAVIILKN